MDMLLSLLLAVDAALQPYVRVDSKAVVLEHVRVIDGTGAPAREDQTLYLVDGKIAGQAPAGAQRLDLQGRTVMPGLVGMHDHLFYPMGGGIFGEMAYSFPRLYLAAGVTTIRTAGSIEPYTDIELKKAIDAGKVPGPTIWISGPYLEGQGSFAVQMHALNDPDDARKFVNFWADQGATSFKAYNTLTRAELGAAIQAAHKRGLKLTAHLCSIGFIEAARLGIDDLEHGLLVDTEFFPGKKPDECPVPREVYEDLAKMSPADPRISALIAELVKLEMAFERAFVRAGGLLMAGCAPTGNGAALAGYGDWRDVELLVDAGFTPLEALKIHSLNGAIWLGQQDRIGSIATGKDADLVVVNGDPSTNIADIEKVEIVFKQGIGFDSKKLVESVRGLAGM